METKKRSIVKAFIWEFISFIGITIIFSIFVGMKTSFYLNLGLTIIKATGLAFYNHYWNKIKWEMK